MVWCISANWPIYQCLLGAVVDSSVPFYLPGSGFIVRYHRLMHINHLLVWLELEIPCLACGLHLCHDFVAHDEIRVMITAWHTRKLRYTWNWPMHFECFFCMDERWLFLIDRISFRTKRQPVKWGALTFLWSHPHHYNDVILTTMMSEITSLAIVNSTVYSCADQRKHQSSASLAFVRGIRRWLVNSPHKGPVTQKMFPFDDVIMMP